LRFTFATCCATFEMRRRKAGGSAHELGNPGDIAAVVPEIAPSPTDAARAAFCVGVGAELRATHLAEHDDVGMRFVYLRGTKRATRKCDVPVMTDWQRSLLQYALRHARGEGTPRRHRADHGPRRYPHAAAGLRRHHGRAARRPARRGLGHSLDRRIETG